MRNIPFKLQLFLRQSQLFDVYLAIQQMILLRRWERRGRTTPPPHVIKQQMIKEYAQRLGFAVFVETGTYRGDMVFALRNTFKKIYSIELSADLYRAAKKRFSPWGHIEILHGDSALVLPQVLDAMREPCLFWLDSHYSAGITARGERETPILQEIAGIVRHPRADRHVLLIDDARSFDGTRDYPSIAALQDFLFSSGYEHFEIKNDIICTYRA